MVAEVVELLAAVPVGVVLDATVGTGGHAFAVLDAYPRLGLFGLDRDRDALTIATARLAHFGERVVLEHARFGDLASVIDAARAAGRGRWPSAGEDAFEGPLVGALFDLGVSSLQLDAAGRGFSYHHDAPLDMRMDPSQGPGAWEVVNETPVEQLTAWFRASGEGRLAGRIARAIVAARPIATTGELAEVVAGAVPAAVRRRGHPAARVFQAIRIAVNDEVEELASALPAALARLAPGGRCLVLAYHSGEGRLVKAIFENAVTGGCVCPPGLPCVCGATAEFRWVHRGSRGPTPAEVAANPRASSARMWAVERLGERGAP